MTPEEKARELINMHYTHAISQKEAIAMVDRVILTRFCQEVDDIDSKINSKEYDYPLVIARIKELKYWQQVAHHVAEIKNKQPI